MLVPLSWLRDFAPFDLDPKELGLVFDDLGMVVEGIEFVGGGLDGVVVARLLEIEPIEGLDRVRMTRVDAGDGEPLEVACGAWNIEPGQLVPLATIGTTLPNGMSIGPVELGLGTDAEGILILDPDGPPPGTPIVDALGIEPDVVYDLAIEGNRPDANCIAGVARDAAARLGLPFTLPSPAIDRAGEPATATATIANESPDLCPRFTATVITGVEIGPSPQWMQNRLTLAGMRPINNVVDASNYVMLELGQPTHPYDLDKLPGRGLLVRRAGKGEILRTLDDVDRRLGEGTDDCVICDAEGNAVGIGGIMGGASSEIDDGTTNVLLEAANFERMAIARTSKRLGLRTEASARFERGVDPEVIELAVERFCELIGTGTVAPGMLDDRSGMGERPHISVRRARVNALLGTDLDGGQITAYLSAIGFTVTGDGDTLDVVPPTFRPDVELEVDVIEEVARHHGYSKIRRTVPRAPQVGTLSAYQRDRRLVREILVGAGISEAQTPSLVGPDDHARAHLDVPLIRASNPMIQEESVLRASLLPGLLRSIAFNVARRSAEVSLFEIGMAWSHPEGDRASDGLDATLPQEDERLAVAIAGAGADAVAAKRVWDEIVGGLRLVVPDLTPTRAAGLHPGRTAAVVVDGEAIGVVGEVDPTVVEEWGITGRVGWIDVDLRRLLAAPRRPLEQAPVSRFPSSDIDLAFVVDESTPAAQVEKALRSAAGDTLIDVRVFDVYRGDRVPAGTRGLAFRLRFNALDRTLTDEELGEVRARAIAEVEAATGATLRS